MKCDLIIAVDFDGTLVEHEYPRVGNRVPFAFETLRALVDMGVRVILHTMRSGAPLAEAVAFCERHGLKFWGVNENPLQSSWTDSPKVYAHIYIDDAALGCPLAPCSDPPGRPVVDWLTVAKRLDPMLDELYHMRLIIGRPA